MIVMSIISEDKKRHAAVFTREVSNRCVIGAMVVQAVICYSDGLQEVRSVLKGCAESVIVL